MGRRGSGMGLGVFLGEMGVLLGGMSDFSHKSMLDGLLQGFYFLGKTPTPPTHEQYQSNH